MERLSLYLRELERDGPDDAPTVSSRQLGLAAGANDAQVRKDLGFVGVTGRPGIGSAREKGSRRPEGLTRVVRLDAGSCDTPATGCHALRTLMSRGEAACHKRVRLMSLAHAGWALARSVVTRHCLRVTGS